MRWKNAFRFYEYLQPYLKVSKPIEEKPIVAFDAGAVREIMEDGSSGILVPLGNIPALAEAITSFLNDSARCNRFGARGREIVEEKFSIDVAIAKTEERRDLCRMLARLEKIMLIPDAKKILLIR
ncbi:MAG: glycosyltransferase [bacterium]|nr:glycosyltransferase [bacterium]